MDSAWQWLTENTSLNSALASFFMLLVWVFYAQLLYIQFRNKNHPHLDIHQAPDMSIESLCLIINMSERLINIVAVISSGFINNIEVCTEITDYQKMIKPENTDNNENDIRSLMKQGPLSPGEFLVAGKFDKIIRSLAKKLDNYDNDYTFPFFEKIEIRFVIFYGQQHKLVGAYRTFIIESSDDKEIKVKPFDLHTKQMLSYWQRKKVNSWINRCVKDK